MSSHYGSFLWFIAILAAIPVVLWMIKRTPLGGASSANALLRSVAVLPLSPGQRVALVEVGQGADRTWLVLGITSQTITTLHTMAPQTGLPDLGALAAGTAASPGATAAEPASQTSPFAQLVDKLRALPPRGTNREP